MALVAGLVAASVALSGCLSSMIPDAAPRPTTSKTADTDGVPAELLPYYEQTLDWSSCSGDFDCATVAAPLDWADPSQGEIELSLIRSRAEGGGEPIGSLLTNPGGPGSSGVALIRDSVSFAVSDPVRQQFDVIGFDPRGVGESTAVTCYDAADMDAYLFDIPENARGTDAWADELLARHTAFGEACEASSDGILPYITTDNSARDMDMMRAVLGDEQLNYLGYSYGTFLGATYAKLFPEKVGRLVLDGAIDPSIPGLDVGITQGIGFESALRAYMADCLNDDECPFRGSVDQAMTDLGTLLADGRQQPHPQRGRPPARRRLAHDHDRLGPVLPGELDLPHHGAHRGPPGQRRPRVPAGRLLLQPAGGRVPRQLDRGFPRVQLHGLSAWTRPSSSRPTPRRCWRPRRRPSRPTGAARIPARSGRTRRPASASASPPRAPLRSSWWGRRTIPRLRTSGRCHWPSSCRPASW